MESFNKKYSGNWYVYICPSMRGACITLWVVTSFRYAYFQIMLGDRQWKSTLIRRNLNNSRSVIWDNSYELKLLMFGCEKSIKKEKEFKKKLYFTVTVLFKNI